MARLSQKSKDRTFKHYAEKLKMHVLEAKQRLLGPEHLDTLSAMGKLANTLGRQGRWKDAEKLQVQVMGLVRHSLDLNIQTHCHT
jgi:hypothetical protein